MPAFTQTVEQFYARISGVGRRIERIGLAVAAVSFVIGLVWAISTFPQSLTLTIWPLAVLLLLGVPLTTVLNAAEFHVMSRTAAVRVGWLKSLETTIFASAANMLPIPGSVVARVAALKSGGATIRVGSTIAVLFAGIWGGTAFCYSGIWLSILGHASLGQMFTAAGIGALGLCFLASLRLHMKKSLLAQALAIRVASLLVDATRQMLAISSLGTSIGFGKASILVVSSFVGSAVSIVPAGLGVREYVVAVLAPLIALPPSAGFLSAAINRCVAIFGLAFLSGVLFLSKRGTQRESAVGNRNR